MSKTFVETSIHIQRFLADGEEQERYETLFAKLAPNLYTSSYVWMEFQRTVVNDFAHIQRLMVTYDRWDQLISHLLDGQRAFRPRCVIFQHS